MACRPAGREKSPARSGDSQRKAKKRPARKRPPRPQTAAQRVARKKSMAKASIKSAEKRKAQSPGREKAKAAVKASSPKICTD